MTITNEIYDKWEASFLNLMDLLSVLSLWKSINFSLFLFTRWQPSMFSVLIWQLIFSKTARTLSYKDLWSTSLEIPLHLRHFLLEYYVFAKSRHCIASTISESLMLTCLWHVTLTQVLRNYHWTWALFNYLLVFSAHLALKW